MTGRATSFYTDSDAFIVSQIKRALQELESGNAFAFATGKEAERKKKKRKERGGKSEAPTNRKQKPTRAVSSPSTTKFKSMLVTSANAATGNQSGAADDAWGSDEDDF